MKKLLLSLSFPLWLCAAYAQTLVTNTPTLSGQIQAVVKVGNTVYIGGNFTQANGVTHNHLARYNALTGVVDDAWNPDINATGTNPFVTTLRRVGGKLVVGGNFNLADGQARQNICMYDLATGALDPWAGQSIISWSTGIGVEGNVFYYADAANIFQGYVKGVNANTGAPTGWQSQYELNGDVNAIGVSDEYVYVGGQFSVVGSGSALNDGLCRFDKVTGVLDTGWQPAVSGGNFGITQIEVNQQRVWIGFTGTTVGGVTRKGVAYFNADGTLGAFNQTSSSYEVYGVVPIGDNVWVAGNSWQLGGATRWKIAEINVYNSQATCWDASAITNGWGYANSAYVAGDTVYIGPLLTVISGSPRPQPELSDLSGPANVAAAQTATYSLPNTAGHTYYWNVTGGSGSSTTNSIDVTWGAGPTGVLRVVENNPGNGSNCHSDTLVLHVNVGGATCSDTMFTTTYSATNNEFILEVDSATMAQSIGYAWDFGDGSTSTASFPTHVYAVNGVYNVCVTTADANGQSCNYCHAIGIDAGGNVVTRTDADGFTINVVPFGWVGIAPASTDVAFDVFPNPTAGAVTVSGLAEGTVVEIADLTGRRLAGLTVHAGTLDLSAFAQGLYLLKTPYGVKRIGRL